MSRRVYYAFMVCILLATQTNWSSASSSFWSWFWPNRNVFISSYDGLSETNLPTVQFEFDDNPDGFIVATSKILASELSKTDICQQRAIISLKQSCNSLSDEDLGKFAMVLLNCQLVAENRPTYECSDSTPFGECVNRMSSEIYNAYNNLYSMAKSICLTIRQSHFRGLAEMTINKLMKSAKEQLSLLNTFKEKHGEIQKSTIVSFDAVAESHKVIFQKHEELKIMLNNHQAQTHENIENILKERELIQSGSNELNEFLTTLKHKYDQSLTIVESQSKNADELFEGVVNDLNKLRVLIKTISNDLLGIASLTNDHRDILTERFAETCSELDTANEIVNSFTESLSSVKSELHWLKTTLEHYFGDNAMEELVIIIFHSLYLLLGMLCMVFANTNKISRITFIAIVGINLVCVITKIMEMQFMILLATNIVIFLIQYLVYLSSEFNWIQYFTISKKIENNNNVPVSQQNSIHEIAFRKSNTVLANERTKNGTQLTSISSRSSLSRGESLSSVLGTDRRTRSRDRSVESTVIDDELRSNRSRRSVSFYEEPIITPSRCLAITIRGTQCRNPVSEGSTSELCSIHERNEKSHER